MKKFVAAAFAVAATSFASSAMADCGKVEIAAMNWASAEMIAQVDALILEEGFGCDVDVVPGDTMPTFTSMTEKGSPEVAPEMWTNAYQTALETAIADGKVEILNQDPITQLGEGWWLLPHTVEAHPELKTVADILARPDLFPNPENPERGAFIGCPAGWGCQLANANMYRAFDMEAKGWDLIDPGSAAGLDGTIANSSQQKTNWFGYYWAPTAMIGKYGLTPVEWGIEFAGNDNWAGCIALPVDDCEDPQPTAWTKSNVATVVTSDFAARAGVAADYLSTRVFPGPNLNKMLVWMQENKANGEDAALEFLITMEDVWTDWVPADVAAKVQKAL